MTIDVTDDIALTVGDLVVQLHDVHSDLNQVADDLRYHQDHLDHDDGSGWDELYDITRELDLLHDTIRTTLNTSLMRPARYRSMPMTGTYFGSWFSTEEPWQRHLRRDARRRVRKARA